MIKRPINQRFNQAILTGRKFTTIRKKAWPVGVPIMLYNWSGQPYRSPHVDVSPVIVQGFWTILIHHSEDGRMVYTYGMENSVPLHETEGFDTPEEMDSWFRPLVPRGETIVRALNYFRVLTKKPLASSSAPHACRVCGGEMKPGRAIPPAIQWSTEGTGSYANWSGPAPLVSVLKCVLCGHSFRSNIKDEGSAPSTNVPKTH